MRAAEDWCAKCGLSVGSSERGKPRGILFGDYAIAKWHNLRQADKDALHGTMTGDMRNGPVVVAIDEHAVRWAGAQPFIYLTEADVRRIVRDEL